MQIATVLRHSAIGESNTGDGILDDHVGDDGLLGSGESSNVSGTTPFRVSPGIPAPVILAASANPASVQAVPSMKIASSGWASESLGVDPMSTPLGQASPSPLADAGRGQHTVSGFRKTSGQISGGGGSGSSGVPTAVPATAAVLTTCISDDEIDAPATSEATSSFVKPAPTLVPTPSNADDRSQGPTTDTSSSSNAGSAASDESGTSAASGTSFTVVSSPSAHTASAPAAGALEGLPQLSPAAVQAASSRRASRIGSASVLPAGSTSVLSPPSQQQATTASSTVVVDGVTADDDVSMVR